MNRIIATSAVVLLFGFVTGTAFAQPTFSVSSGSGLVGSGAPVVINMNWASDGTVVVADLRVTYDAANLSVTEDCSGNAQWQCNDNGSGTVTVLGFDGNNVLNSGLVGTLSFDISTAAAGAYEIPVVVIEYGNASAQVVAADQTPADNGQIDVQGLADYSSSPAPGALPLGSVAQGGTNPTTTVDISNVGAAGTLLDVNCVEFPDTAAFSISGGSIVDLTPAASPSTVTVSCDASQAPATYNGIMRCTHNGDGTTTASPANYALSCTVTPGPTPGYGSTPAPGSTLDFGSPAKNSVDPELPVSIDNTGDGGTTLSGSCSISSNPNGAYAITAGGGAYSVLQGAAAHDLTVSCDTAIPGDHNGGVLSCSHNGSNIASPATYTLNCDVPGEPAFTGTPNLDLGPVPQNNTDPTGTLAIDNTGDANSVLDGSCALTDGTGPITLQSGSGVYSVTEAGAMHVVTVVCDSADLPGAYNDTLSCTHDDPGQASPVTFPVSCTIAQPDAAVFGSTPVSGSTIDITSGLDAVVGDPDPTAPLQIRNDADAGDADMSVSCSLSDVVGTAITVAPPVAGPVLAPGESQNVTFTCDTAAANAPGTPFEATYTCDWTSVPEQEIPVGLVMGAQESYTVTCEVRDPIADIDPNPPGGTTLTQVVQPGGSAQFQVVFAEVAAEGIDGGLDCALDSGADFTILSPDFSSPPLVVPAGDSVTVTVEGTDPGGVQSVTDTLRCTFFDSSSGEGGTEVVFPLVLTIGGSASFQVNKVFTDGNPGEVLVSISCNTGLPLNQSKVITANAGVTFIVDDFDSGEMDCSITEEALAGYSATYLAAGDSQSDSTGGCHFSAVAGGDDNTCQITNTPDSVDVVITKDFLFEGNSEMAGLDTSYELTLFCDSQIVDGFPLGGVTQEAPESIIVAPCGLIAQVQEGGQLIAVNDWCKTFNGDGPDVFTAQVIPEFPSSNCFVVEQVFDNAIEVDNGCQNLTVSAGEGASCTITNTAFFEGIPTLNQYGLALLALLLMGAGFVGFRRFA